MHIEKKLVMRRSGNVFACMGQVRVLSDDYPVIPHGAWEEATGWITKESIRFAAPEQEVKEHCISLTNKYIIDNGYVDDEEEFF